MLVRKSCQINEIIAAYKLFYCRSQKFRNNNYCYAQGRVISSMFSTENKKQMNIKQAVKKLLDSQHKIKPQIAIQLLYKLKVQAQKFEDTKAKQILPQKAQIEIIKSVIQQLSSIRKIETIGYILKLMQKHQLRYDQDNKWTVLINRYFLYLKLLKISTNPSVNYAREFRIMLQLLDEMNFPRITLNNVLNIYLEGMSNKNLVVEASKTQELLKIIIMTLQNKKIYLSNTKRLIEQALSNYEFESFQCFAMLFYIKQILSVCIQQKISYQLSEGQIRDIMLNPFSSLQTENQNTRVKQSQQEQIKQRQAQLKNLKYQLDKQSQDLQNLCNDKMQLQKIKHKIIKFIQSEDISLSGSILFYLLDLSEIKPRIKQFFDENYLSMRPIQFMHFLKKLCLQNKSYIQEESQQYLKTFKKYIETLSQYMDTSQLIYLYIQANKTAKIPITIQQIKDVVKKIEVNNSISYQQFDGVVKLISNLSKQAKQEESQQIEEIITKIKKISEN